MPAGSTTAPLLDAIDVTKQYGGIRALSGASLSVGYGEVHALVGENGAGKSTLIKILTGAVARNGGTIMFDGTDLDVGSPLAARSRGISVIHQELNLIPFLSIAENIFIGRFPKRFGLIDWKAVETSASVLMTHLGLDCDVRRPLSSCSTSLQQMTAIARAISEGGKLVIMDEPTSSLDEREVETLLNTVRSLRRDGISVLFISHRMNEIYAVCDRVTVLRDGRTVRVDNLLMLPRPELGSRLIDRQSQNMTVAARATADRKVLAHLS